MFLAYSSCTRVSPFRQGIFQAQHRRQFLILDIDQAAGFFGGVFVFRRHRCDTVADDNQQLIPYIQGKRCWVNKIIYGDTTAVAMQTRPDGERQIFAAGDSDTDIEVMRDGSIASCSTATTTS